MSGHRKFSELTKDFSPERKRRIAAETAKLLARYDREVHIEPIMLEWSEWHSWRDVERNAREGGAVAPSNQPGVYEAKISGRRERLAIGKARDLRMRVKQGLMRGKGNAGEPAREDVGAGEDAADVVVRWAVTERPAAVVEELRIRHKGKFGELPKYTRDD